MAHGLNPALKRPQITASSNKGTESGGKTGIGSRRIFAPHFKLQVLDSYRNDADCKGNQRATARKYGIHRRQIQKWLQCENVLRNSVVGKIKSNKPSCDQQQQQQMPPEARKCGIELALRGSNAGRQRDDSCGGRATKDDGCGASGHDQGALGQQRHCCCSTDARVPALSPNYAPHSPTIGNHYLHEAPAAIALATSPAVVAPLQQAVVPAAPWPLATTTSAVVSPLDYTVHSRASPTTTATVVVADPAAPMDLSLKNQQQAPAYYAPPLALPESRILYPSTPVSPLCASATSPIMSAATVNSTTLCAQHQSSIEVWDLSTKTLKRKIKEEEPSSPDSPKPKPVKLFKPYLDDLHDEDDVDSKDVKKPRDSVIIRNKSFIPCCNAIAYPHERESAYYNNNNNNNNHIVSSEYSYCFPEYPVHRKAYHVYSLEETYMYPPHLCSYEEGGLLHPMPLRQRQSYSVDFKLSTIECYYQDTKGSTRKPLHKWVKPEDEFLVQKNETFKTIHAVR
ncbi:uncharacterized protein LOC108742671 [Agrilus planipennis]|uniref:Uncharacterized protein LOC108742671 n=1 Tax=Agrilus planipennis TaxID=224129 RepID=A0A1W4XBR4_AGRPL|nr:uncharacterized protein LOC108742671 [Agrilus planipennis]